MLAEERKYDHVVLALDTLIGDPEIIQPKKNTPKIANNLIISRGYVTKFFDTYYEQSTRGDSARQCMDILNEHLKRSNSNSVLKLANGTNLRIHDLQSSRLKEAPSSQQVIEIAKHYKKTKGKANTAIMTGSSRLAPVVRLDGLPVLEMEREIYTGRREVVLPYEYSNEWYSNKKISVDLFAEICPECPALRPNEFVEFLDPLGDQMRNRRIHFENIGRYDSCKKAIVPLKWYRNLPYNIYPRNPGQAMLAEALLMPPEELPVVIVPGNFGSGKTFLTLAAGIAQVEPSNNKDRIYDNIFICPRDSFLGREHGFLKGDLMEKLRPQLGPFMDNYKEIIKIRGNKPTAKGRRNNKSHSVYADYNYNDPSNPSTYHSKIVDEIKLYFSEYSPIFEFDAVINMGGRSINDSFIIYDEFQDTERSQARALLTRIGRGSKNIVMGDPSQFTNPHLSRSSNGLVYASNVFSNSDLAATITMLPNECERSAAAKAIAKIFEAYY